MAVLRARSIRGRALHVARRGPSALTCHERDSSRQSTHYTAVLLLTLGTRSVNHCLLLQVRYSMLKDSNTQDITRTADKIVRVARRSILCVLLSFRRDLPRNHKSLRHASRVNTGVRTLHTTLLCYHARPSAKYHFSLRSRVVVAFSMMHPISCVSTSIEMMRSIAPTACTAFESHNEVGSMISGSSAIS